MGDPSTSEELILQVADTTLACGLRYGLWVERAPSTEEQVAVSSMSQDKLGQARQFYQVASEATGADPVELQYDRSGEAFAWNPAWLSPWPSWSHLVTAQVTLGRALLTELESLAEGTRLREPFAKIQQEDSWHARHGTAWLAQADHDQEAREAFQSALEDLWPQVVGYFGAADDERFPEDVSSGALTRGDDEMRRAFLDEVVPQLEEAGLDVPADETGDGYSLDPTPSSKLVDRLQDEASEVAIELVGMLQDPTNRELAEL